MEWNKQGNNFVLCQMTQLSVSEACKELINCRCKANKGSSRRCSCWKVGLPSTDLCKCGGMCDWTESSLMLLLDCEVTVFLFFFHFLCHLLWFGLVIIAPRVILIDHLTFNFAKKKHQDLKGKLVIFVQVKCDIIINASKPIFVQVTVNV